MAGESGASFSLLHRTCKLVVLLCFLHISVTVVFYVRSLDLRFAFVQNQQSNNRTGRPAGPPRGTEAQPGQGPPERKAPEVKAVPELKKCPETSPLLVGPMRVEFNMPVSLEKVKQANPQVQVGGRSRPSDCVALQKVAVIIPFRNRDEHLKYWLYYLHPILQRQQLDYGVYVINQRRLSHCLLLLLHDF